MIQTKKLLDKMGCGNPNCTHDHSVLYLHSACHTGAGVYAVYTKATGVLSLECAVCGKPVADMEIK